MKDKTVCTLTEYIEYIEKNFDDDLTLFRGQREDKVLLPKIARLELRDDVKNIEKIMLDDFKRRAIPYLDREIKLEWDWLSLAQHHGMATRLLDWTENPLTGLWFTVQKPPEETNPGVVWIFRPPKIDVIESLIKSNPYSGERTKVFQPNYITKRIVNQDGWFTVHKYITQKKKFIPLNLNNRYKKYLTKIIIPADTFSNFRYQLDRCNVNAASLFPDLDGLARHIQWSNSFLNDECTEEI